MENERGKKFLRSLSIRKPICISVHSARAGASSSVVGEEGYGISWLRKGVKPNASFRENGEGVEFIVTAACPNYITITEMRKN